MSFVERFAGARGRRSAAARFAMLARAGLLAAVLAVAAVSPTAALAKDFSIGSISIESTVAPNGDLAVVEHREVTFDGQFSWVEWDLRETGSQGIEVVGVTAIRNGIEQDLELVDGTAFGTGTYSVVDDGGGVTAHVAFSALDETIEYRIEYVARGAAKRYADTGELYWQFVGDRTSLSAGPVNVTIAPPAAVSKEQVRAWAHGPLTGTVDIAADGAVTLAVPELPANTFVEARVLYPAEALAAAAVIDEPRLQAVLNEEAKWANDANYTRIKARVQVWLAIGIPALLSLGGVIFALWAFLAHGKEYRSSFAGEYLREDPRPDLSPGVIGSLWRFGTPNASDVAATLMDLADKKVVSLKQIVVQTDGFLGMGAKEEPSFELGLNPTPPDGVVQPTDKLLLDLLFETIGAGGIVTLDEIKSYAKDNPKSYTDDLKAWYDACEAQADTLGMFEGNSWSWRVGIAFLAGTVGVVGFFATVIGESVVPVCVAVPGTAIIALIATKMTRRSRAGNDLYAQYKAVEKYLKDFGRLDEVPPASIVLWNRFLVLAVTFGIATQVIEQMRVKMPTLVSDPAFQTTYWWVYAGSGYGSPVSSLAGGFASASSIASSEMSSSSGGGGGFSGGGGGGGGGGGFSAG